MISSVASAAQKSTIVRAKDRIATSRTERLAGDWPRPWPSTRLISTDGLGHYRILRDHVVVKQVVEFVSGTSIRSVPPTTSDRREPSCAS